MKTVVVRVAVVLGVLVVGMPALGAEAGVSPEAVVGAAFPGQRLAMLPIGAAVVGDVDRRRGASPKGKPSAEA